MVGAHVRMCTVRVRHVARISESNGVPGELFVTYMVDVSQLLHALGACERGVDVHWSVGLLHCGGGLSGVRKGLFCSKAVQVPHV